MPFLISSQYDQKIAQKCFKRIDRLDRIKIQHPNRSEILCMLCDDSALLFQNIVFCTKESVYYLGDMGISLSKFDFSYISAVTLESVHSFSSVCITISNGSKSPLYVATKDASKMADYIQSNIIKPVPSTIPSVADEILKYKNLLDCGAITDAEYLEKKRQLLDI